MNSQRSQLIFVGVIVLAVLVVAIGLIGRSGGQPAAPAVVPNATPVATAAPANAIVVSIESSNTKEDWMNLAVEKFNASGAKIASGQPIVVKVKHGGSGTGMDAILAGESQPVVYSPGTYVWIKQLNQKWQDRTNRVLIKADCPALTSEPFGIALWQPMAQALGWPDKPIGLSDIAKLAADPNGWASFKHPEWGTFKFGHGHPDYSNSGLLTMIAATYAGAGLTSGLTPDIVKSATVITSVRALEQSVFHYGRLSTDLFDRMTVRGPGYLHAITAFESDVVKWNRQHGSELRFPLVFIAPADGTFWTEHPYCILDGADWVTAEQKEAAEIFKKYLLDPAQQAAAVTVGLRPADLAVPLIAPLDAANGANPNVTAKNSPNLEYPADETVTHILDVFHQVKKKATVILIVDTSGSMLGEKLKGALDGANSFLQQMEPDERVSVIAFASKINELNAVGRVGDVREELAQRVAGLYAQGNTALHQVVITALDRMDEIQKQDTANGENRLYGIVLLTDGKNEISGGPSEADLLSRLPAGDQPGGVKLFTISYGADANKDLMKTLANRTNGKNFEGTPQNIRSVYLAISSEF
jgi:Ca-activated chloride channel family protein